MIFVSVRLRADLMLLLCALFWGGTFVAIEMAVHQMPPYLMVALRFLSAAAAFFPFFLYLKLKREPAPGKAASTALTSVDSPSSNTRTWWSPFLGPLAGLALGVVSFAGYGLQTHGLVFTTPARSAFITQLLVVFTFPMQILFLRRKVIPSAYAGLALVLCGAYFLLGSPAGGNWNQGDWLTIGCALYFALLIVLLDVFSRRFGTADLTFYQILGTGVLAAAASGLGLDKAYLPEEENGRDFLLNHSYDGQLILALLYLALPATIGTVLLQVRFQKETSPARASLLYAMEPVFAGLFAYLILGQFLGWSESFGALLIVIGVIVSEVFSAKKTNHNQSGD